jgi:hypothetical protein
MPRPDRDTVLVGVTVPRAHVPAALAALRPGEVLVAVRIPRGELPAIVDAATLSRLGAIGTLYTHAERSGDCAGLPGAVHAIG